jgi:hypothetical protein
VSALDVHLLALDAMLRGPADARQRLIAEARAGLYDARDAYLDAGLDPDEAIDLALRDFGAVRAVRAAFQQELYEVQARRTARLLACKVPIVVLLWWASWAVNPQQHWQLPAAVKIVSVALGAVALLAALTGYLSATRGYGRLLVPAAVLSTGSLLSSVLLHAVPSYRAMTWPPMLPVAVLTVLLATGLVLSTRRCRLTTPGTVVPG